MRRRSHQENAVLQAQAAQLAELKALFAAKAEIQQYVESASSAQAQLDAARATLEARTEQIAGLQAELESTKT